MPPGEPLLRPDWIVDNLDIIGERLAEHVGMTATAVVVGFLIPFTGISFLTAEIALVSYTLLILVRNILLGLDSVPSDVLEAADGMGYTSRQRLWRVELPIALPIIVAGLRIATVTTVGL